MLVSALVPKVAFSFVVVKLARFITVFVLKFGFEVGHPRGSFHCKLGILLANTTFTLRCAFIPAFVATFGTVAAATGSAPPLKEFLPLRPRRPFLFFLDVRDASSVRPRLWVWAGLDLVFPEGNAQMMVSRELGLSSMAFLSVMPLRMQTVHLSR